MNGQVIAKTISSVLLVLLTATGVFAGTSPQSPADAGLQNKLRSFGNLLEGVPSSGPVCHEFIRIYEKHKGEIEKILNENPLLIWKTLEVLLKASPALHTIEENGGKLYLDKKVFLSALALLEAYKETAGPPLARAIGRAKKMVKGRAKDTDTEQVVIDLNG